MPFTRLIKVLSLLASASLTATACRAADLSAGPLFDQFGLALAAGQRLEILGPLWSTERRGTESAWTLSPLLSWQRDPDLDTASLDFAYPVLTYDRFGAEYRFQFFQLLSWSGGQSQKGLGASRFTLFPFYFQQRSPDPSRNYTALWPLYGRMQNHIFRDEIKFLAWPAYVQTRKKEVVTDNFLVPFFHLRHGPALRGWQLWPLAGRERKDPTTSTNGFGDAILQEGHRKFFLLWPFYFHNDLGLGTTNPISQRVLVPFFSRTRSPARDASVYFWPFGLTVTDDREKRFHEVGVPWPLVGFARGEGKTVNRFWPLFGQAHNQVLESDFYLWPLYKYNRARSEPLDRARTRVLFFLYSDLTERNTATGQALQRTDLWPLFTARRDLEGNERFQLLAVLEPFLPNNKSIERLYSPLWSIWRSEANPRTGVRSQSFLWNLYRREVTPKARKCSVLFGLVQHESGPEGAHWRWFHLPAAQRKLTREPGAAVR